MQIAICEDQKQELDALHSLLEAELAFRFTFFFTLIQICASLFGAAPSVLNRRQNMTIPQ